MFTKNEILNLVEEMKVEEKKSVNVPHYYKRHGQMVRRQYDDTIYTARYKELFFDREGKLLRSKDAEIFKCRCCGQKVNYFDLETWCCDFENDNYICAECYENEMGEYL